MDNSINWEIADSETLKTTEIGNNANRFDAHSQTGTLGANSPMAPNGPIETGDTTHEGS